jgi:hypothetical protein
MSCGASHLLNYEIARTLQSRSMDVYNLGGIHELDSGLAEFKLRFGSRLVELEAAEFFLGGALRKGLTTAVRMARGLRGLRAGAAKGCSRRTAAGDSRGQSAAGDALKFLAAPRSRAQGAGCRSVSMRRGILELVSVSS